MACEPLAGDPGGPSGGSALENDLEAAAPPGILCKRKEKAQGLEGPLGALKAAEPPGRCQQRAGFEGPGRLPGMPGRVPRPRSPLRPGAPSDGSAPRAGGPPGLEVGDAGAGGPASGEGPVHGISQEAAEIGPGVGFPRDSRVTVRSWAGATRERRHASSPQVQVQGCIYLVLSSPLPPPRPRPLRAGGRQRPDRSL